MIKLNGEQLKKLADIFADFGIVITASAVLPSILGKQFNSSIIIGVLLSIIFWATSIRLLTSKNL